MSEITSAQRARLAELLDVLDLQARTDLRASLLQSGEDRYVNLAGRVHDLADESVADMLTDLESSFADRYLRELRDIETARARLAKGTFNCCTQCNGEIGLERLLANPLAVRCLECQCDRERTHAHDTMPKL